MTEFSAYEKLIYMFIESYFTPIRDRITRVISMKAEDEITVPHELPIDKEKYKELIMKQELLRKKKLLPKYWKAPSMVMWDITHKCNLRCIHCYNYAQDPMDSEFDSHELFTLAEETTQKRRYFKTGIRVDYPMLVFYFLLNSRSGLEILGLVNEMCKKFNGILKIR